MAELHVTSTNYNTIIKHEGVAIKTCARRDGLTLLLDADHTYVRLTLRWSEVAELLAALTPVLHSRCLAAELAHIPPELDAT